MPVSTDVSYADLKLALDVLTEGGTMDLPQSLSAVRSWEAAQSWSYDAATQGLGIGPIVRDAEVLDGLAIKVYVARKLPRSKVKHLVPKTVNLPGMAGPVPTDVEEIGEVRLESNTVRVRPAVPGFGLGHSDVDGGTFGCLVRRKDQPENLYILSNCHVLADEGAAKVGDPIIQPGRHDGGKTPADTIATLSQWVPFQFTQIGFPNLVDAAIAKVAAKEVTSFIHKIGVPSGVSSYVRRGMRVHKTGRTTDYTQGIIRDINYRLSIHYKKPGGGKGRAGLRDQVLCTRFTAQGDSGAAVLNMSNKVVGLHFAGSESSSIFNRIEHVLGALNVSVVTSKL